MKPATQYTKHSGLNIAYQVFGSGPIDLVYIPGWVSNIDMMWACPELVNFLLELGKMARVILFDKRGTGLSDRIVELSTLEERMDDIRAVMDAVGSQKAVLFGHSEGGSVSALFAATYPNRTISLITFGIFAKRRYAPDYPWAPTDEERQVVYDMIENSWGSGEMNLESLAPSKAGDKIFMDWLANYFRSGASPSAAMVLTKMNTAVDIIDMLGFIKVPTLLLQRIDDIDVKIEEGRFIAERIKGSRFVALEGNDHLFWVGDTQVILNEMRAFITNVNPVKSYEERLNTTPDELNRVRLPHNDSFLENILRIIDNHLSNELFGVNMLCRELGTSERQLQRKLKAITNKSPNQLISSVRLHRAKELILGRRHNISEIAFQTGFSNPSYFSKSFKKEFGLSPTDLLQKQAASGLSEFL
jgi:pimeloyl-ACP methyl ester carboxylesterase/AraC-like DNA-binding protein